MSNNDQAVNEIIKILVKEEPNMACEMECAIIAFMDEGFENATIGQISLAFASVNKAIGRKN